MKGTTDDESTQAPLNYEPPQPSVSYRRKFRIIFWSLFLSLVIAMLLMTLAPSNHKVRILSARISCAAHLKQIGMACTMYANEHQDQLPDALADLLTNDMGTQVFTCPATHNSPADGPTMQAVVDSFKTPGHCSYLYVGKGLKSTVVDANTVLAYEPLADHGGQGMNVLFGDGHVEFLTTPGVLPWVAAAKGGAVKRPPNGAGAH